MPPAPAPLEEAQVHGPADEYELKGIAERHAGKRLNWYSAYGGNLYAEDGAVKYAIRPVHRSDMTR